MMQKDNIVKKLKPYYRKFGYDYKFEFDKLALKQFEGCERILDIGCGVGRFISHDPRRIEGVDHNEETLSICREKGFKVQQCKVDENFRLPFEDNSFDGVHSAHLIEHLFPKEAHQLLKEMDRVLKPGGVLIIRAPLMHPGFYFDLSHIRPYPPQALFHYLQSGSHEQKSLGGIRGHYELLKLKYRRPQFFIHLRETKSWFLYPFFNILKKIGIHSFRKTGYFVAMKKDKR